jgi:hypothetical protein
MRKQSEKRLWARALAKLSYLGPAIVGVGVGGIVLVVFKDVLFRGFHESTLGFNSFVAVASVVLVIVAVIVADTRMKNRALSERATKLAEMAKRLSATVEQHNMASAEPGETGQPRAAAFADADQMLLTRANAVLDNARLLRGSSGLSQAERRAVEAILSNGEKLARLINGMVEGSGSERGRAAADHEIGPRRGPAVALPEHLLVRLDHAVKARNVAPNKAMLGEIQSVLDELGELGPEARALSSLIAAHLERADLAAISEVVRGLEADRPAS